MQLPAFLSAESLSRAFGYTKRVAFTIFAIIGLFYVGLPVACTMVRPAFYADENFRPIIAPGGRLAVHRRVTTGGFGTVWTTKLIISEIPEGKKFLIYKAKDSDYVPKTRWVNPEMVLVELPCDRVDHLSSPSDWDEGKTPMQRVAVRFIYPDSCNPMLLAQQ
jgi:hypothetical protein